MPLNGVLPVFQTPFHEDYSVDYETLGKEIDWLLDRGASGVVMAMVSETLRLSSEERDQVAAWVCQRTGTRGSAVISVGAESTVVALRHARVAESSGAAAIMAIPPIATALGVPQILDYYGALLEATSPANCRPRLHSDIACCRIRPCTDIGRIGPFPARRAGGRTRRR